MRRVTDDRCDAVIPLTPDSRRIPDEEIPGDGFACRQDLLRMFPVVETPESPSRAPSQGKCVHELFPLNVLLGGERVPEPSGAKLVAFELLPWVGLSENGVDRKWRRRNLDGRWE